MSLRGIMFAVMSGGLAACAAEPTATDESVPYEPEYMEVKTRLLDNDLVNFEVKMKGARDNNDVADYLECAAAQYALIRGYGFTRHVRTNVANEGGIWRGDAVYTISPSLPQGLRTIDAEVAVQNCAAQGIPTV